MTGQSDQAIVATAILPEDAVLVGKINGLFGLQGWMKVYSWMRPPQQIFDFACWWLVPENASQAATTAQYRLRSSQRHGKGLVVQLQDCESRDQAAQLVNRQIFVAAAEFGPLPKGEYYWHQLIGLEVRNQDQKLLGVVEELLETGANDVLVIAGDRQRLLPYIPTVVIAVDISQRRILVDWDLEF